QHTWLQHFHMCSSIQFLQICWFILCMIAHIFIQFVRYKFHELFYLSEGQKKRGKLLASHRYNLRPLLHSCPGGLEGSWSYKTYPATKLVFFLNCKRLKTFLEQDLSNFNLKIVHLTIQTKSYAKNQSYRHFISRWFFFFPNRNFCRIHLQNLPIFSERSQWFQRNERWVAFYANFG